MDLFHHKVHCEKCNLKFKHYDELVQHSKVVHHIHAIKCDDCHPPKEFLHEKDRLHHQREKHKTEIYNRIHRGEFNQDKTDKSLQDNVDKATRNFSDNF
ncbi:MAG: hypothetical protein ACPKPY_01295 [Nitrososphaeraceae archaeon]